MDFVTNRDDVVHLAQHRPKGRGTKAAQRKGGGHQSHAHIRMHGVAAHQFGGHGIHGLGAGAMVDRKISR